MAYALLAHTVSGTNSGGTTSSGIDTSGADLLVVATAFYVASTPPTLSDSQGGGSNTYTPLTLWNATGSSICSIRIFYCQAPTHVGTGHTFTLTEPNSYASLAVLALSGSKTSPFDQENGLPNGSVQTGSVTPSEDNEILIAMVGDGTAGSASTGVNSSFTFLDRLANSTGAYFGIATAYQIQTTATARNPTFSGQSATAACSAAIATFKQAAAGSGKGAYWYYSGGGA